MHNAIGLQFKSIVIHPIFNLHVTQVGNMWNADNKINTHAN